MKPAHGGARSVAGKAALVVGATRRCLMCEARAVGQRRSRRRNRFLTEELRRQRQHGESHEPITDREITLVLDILRELTRDPGFVALMNTRGFTTLPRLLHEAPDRPSAMRKAQSPRFICRTVSSGNRGVGILCPEAAAMVGRNKRCQRGQRRRSENVPGAPG